jgi:hypothetical protein
MDLNVCSNTNAELTCSLVLIETATVVFKIDISTIHWEHVNLNAAYILSGSYRIRVFDGMEKGALLLQLLGLQQCILCQEASQRILRNRTLFTCYFIRKGFNSNIRRTTPGAVEIPSCRRGALISTSIYCFYPTHTSHLSRRKMSTSAFHRR